MSFGLRQLSMVASPVVYPLAVAALISVETTPLARSARTPWTYNWRVWNPAGTGADQRPPLPFVQPVIGIPPLISGRAPLAALQITRCPLPPESRASRVSGWVNGYVPPARLTTMSPVMLWSSPRTRSRACWRVRTGWPAEVPGLASLPEGETYTVVCTAACAGYASSAAVSAAAPSTAPPRTFQRRSMPDPFTDVHLWIGSTVWAAYIRCQRRGAIPWKSRASRSD